MVWSEFWLWKQISWSYFGSGPVQIGPVKTSSVSGCIQTVGELIPVGFILDF